jgi:putative ABC transport system permease protein
MLAIAHDLRFGLRNLFKNPGFTAVAVLSLGLGIGAITSVYSMISAVLLTPLPFEDAYQLHSLKSFYKQSGEIGDSVSYPEYIEWQKQSTSFEYVAAYSSTRFNMTGSNEPVRIATGLISHTFFPMLRFSMHLGRNFTADEDKPGAEKTVILSYKMWMTQFGGSQDVLNESVVFDGEPFRVIGVAPEDFLFLPVFSEAFVALGANSKYAGEWTASWLDVLARLKDGVTPDQAQVEMSTIADRLAQQYPNFQGDKGIRLVHGNDEVENDVTGPFTILFGVVAFVLLIACANVANLLLSKAAARQKEIAIRVALGASRIRIVRQLLTEALLLASIGGALGILITMWGLDIIVALLPAENAQAYVDFFQFGMNPDVLAFSGAASVLTGLVFGLAPALQASKPNLNETLKEGGAGAGVSRNRHRILNGLVILEVALALVLLIGATLMVQSYSRLQTADPGFDTTNLLTASIELPAKSYPNATASLAFFNKLEERIANIPGVTAVGGTTTMPFGGSNSTYSISFEHLPALPPGQHRVAGYCAITPGYFDTLGATIVSGRAITSADTNPKAPVALINQAFADHYWRGQDPLGQRFCLGPKFGAPDRPPIRVVGVVSNFAHETMREKIQPAFFLPLAERPVSDYLSIAIRSAQPPDALAGALRQIVKELDPNQPLSDLATMQELLAETIWMDRFTTMLFAMFSGLALFLAVIGVYGVINYSVIQQTHEIGVRMALGAQPKRVLNWVVSRGLRLAIYGLLLGLPLTFALAQQLQNLLYGISPYDPITFVLVSALLLLIAACASFLPAKRATGVDPMIALRYE